MVIWVHRPLISLHPGCPFSDRFLLCTRVCLSLVEILDVVVQHHLLSNLGVDDVDGVDRVVDVGRPRQDEYAPEAAEDDEEPEEEPVQHHGHDAPVLVLLQGREKGGL